MKREFTVTITRTDECKVIIDEDKIEGLVEEFEDGMYSLGSDKAKGLAEHIGIGFMDNFNQEYEGVGFVVTDGIDTNKKNKVDGVEIETKYLEETEIEVEEKK